MVASQKRSVEVVCLMRVAPALTLVLRYNQEVDQSLLGTRIPPARVPALLPFLGYSLFFPSFILGPACDYVSYEALVDGTLFTFPPGTSQTSLNAGKENTRRMSQSDSQRPQNLRKFTADDDELQTISESTIKRPHPRLLIPRGRKTVAYRKLLIGLFFLGVFMGLSGVINYERILKEKLWWSSKSWLSKLAYTFAAGFMARTKYYGIWSLSEVSFTLSLSTYCQVQNGVSPSTPSGSLYLDRNWFQRIHHRRSRQASTGTLGSCPEH